MCEARGNFGGTIQFPSNIYSFSLKVLLSHYEFLANHVRVRQLAHVRALLDDSRAAPVAETATIAARVTATTQPRTATKWPPN